MARACPGDPGGSSPNLARKSRPRGGAASDFYCHRCIKKRCIKRCFVAALLENTYHMIYYDIMISNEIWMVMSDVSYF